MRLYLREIAREPLLTRDEERALALAIRSGDSAARAKMICANLRLVVAIAREFLGRGLGLADLTAAGNLGLIRATADYDPDRGVKFSTFAKYSIRAEIHHAIHTEAPTIRLPESVHGLLAARTLAWRAFLDRCGAEPRPGQVEALMGWSAGEGRCVAAAVRSRHWAPRIDAIGRSGAHEPLDPGPAPDAADAARELARELGRELAARLERLDDRSRAIILARYPLDGTDRETLASIGLRLGLSMRQVHTREVHALKTMALPPVAARSKELFHVPLPRTQGRAGRAPGRPACAAL